MRILFRKLRKSIINGLIGQNISIPDLYLEKYKEFTALRTLIKSQEINCVLDVGANVGQFAKDLRSIGFKGKIISFEPVKKTYVELETQLKTDSEWAGFNFALGNVNEFMEINVGDDSAMASIHVPNYSESQTVSEVIEVRTLDSMFDKLDFGGETPRLLLKMDTQGYDTQVFEGAIKSLEHVFAIMSEISVIPLYQNMVDYKDALTIYQEAGFKLSNLSCVSKNSDGDVIELNCLMRKSVSAVE